jgi:hypothetical protein
MSEALGEQYCEPIRNGSRQREEERGSRATSIHCRAPGSGHAVTQSGRKAHACLRAKLRFQHRIGREGRVSVFPDVCQCTQV